MIHTIQELKQKQSMPLKAKIIMTENRIRGWYNHFNGNVYISFSGGKDSTVLLNIARSIYPDIKAMYVDTGLEYPEIREFVKTFDNVDIIRPKKSFYQVIKEYGYPVISKEVAEKIGISLQSLSYKINNKIEFRASEMERLCNLLNITDKDSYFFYSSNSQNG